MTGESEFFEVLVVSQGFEYRISNFTMNDFRRDRLPNFKEPDNILCRPYYRIAKHRPGSHCQSGCSRWVTGENGKLKMLDNGWDSSG
ncbi:MAG: hypothetical protein Q7S43_04630 [bacterium]|nr:hypothetical protein [bacterium]